MAANKAPTRVKERRWVGNFIGVSRSCEKQIHRSDAVAHSIHAQCLTLPCGLWPESHCGKSTATKGKHQPALGCPKLRSIFTKMAAHFLNQDAFDVENPRPL
jgi:hypothetical protein